MPILRSGSKIFRQTAKSRFQLRALQAEQFERRELMAADLCIDDSGNTSVLLSTSASIAAPTTFGTHNSVASLEESLGSISTSQFGQLSRQAEGESSSTALDAYVAAPDSSYSFSILATTAGVGYKVYDVAMTSQTWRSVSETTWNQWKHRVTIVIPDQVTSGKSLLMVGAGGHGGAGGFGNGLSTAEISEAASLAISTGTVVSNISQVPYQPLQFSGETFRRSEDAIIAKTLRKFLDGGDDNWPTLLPMVKSVVRAMDTVQSIALAEEGVTVTDFVVSGASKRGWTTWLTAAVDSRVSAIAPMVINVLNMDEQMAHHKKAYAGVTASIVGGYSLAVQDYVNEGIFNDLYSPRSQELLKIIDPFEYRNRLTMPKLMLNGTGDEFFLPDSDQFFFDQLPGNNYVRYLPNRGHGLGPEALTARNQFYQAMVSGSDLPRFSWTVDPSGAIRVTTTDAPVSVQLWQATNLVNRDFRQNISNTSWTSSALAPAEPGRYVGNVVAPPTGHTAFFVELTYNVQGQPMKLTTQVSVRSANRAPIVSSPLGSRSADEDLQGLFVNLNQHFDDPDIATAGDRLTYRVISNSNSSLVNPLVDGTKLFLPLVKDAHGLAEIVVEAKDTAGLTVRSTLLLQVRSVSEPDKTRPISKVDSLPARSSSKSFTVRVTGRDRIPANPDESISGVASYDIFVAEGNGSFKKLTTVPASAPETNFNGRSNTTYFFRSIARDVAGNIESKRIVAEAQTYVPDLDAPVTLVHEVSATTPNFQVFMRGTDSGGSRLSRFKVYVSVDGAQPNLIAETNAGLPDSQGIYRESVPYQAIADGTSHTYRFYSVGIDQAGNTESTKSTGDLSIQRSFTATSTLAATGIDVQKGQSQRSYIRHVDILFNSDSGLQSIISSLNDASSTNDRVRLQRFNLDGSGIGTDVSLIGAATQNGRSLSLDFGANGLGGNRNSAAGNGYYRLSIDSDGNGSADQVFHFYRLLGDTNGDRTVSMLDVRDIALAISRRVYDPNWDINGDGVVNLTDRRLAADQQRMFLAGGLSWDD